MLGDKKNLRKTVWLYAVILFTSAFVVLLLTYYSQLKTDKSISDYLAKLSKEEKRSLLYQTNLNSALEEKNMLNKELDNLRKKLNEERDKLKAYKDDTERIKKNYLDTVNAYDQLLYAENEYNKGNYIKSADILLNDCDNEFLNSLGKDIYNRLAQDAFDKASRALYMEGYKFYKDKSYAEAIQKFSQSLNFSKHNYLSDDCYYLRAYSYLKLGDKINAVKDFEDILINYNDSGYVKDIERLIKVLK